MNHVQRLVLLTILLLLTCFLTACGNNSIQVGLVETLHPGVWQASYVTFNGSKTAPVRADVGGTLLLAYEAEVDSGELELLLVGPDDQVLWDLSILDLVDDTVELDIVQDGRYTLVARGKDTRGSFDLNWIVK